jgi:hypothetical protein
MIFGIDQGYDDVGDAIRVRPEGFDNEASKH